MSQAFKQCTFVFADEDNTGVKMCRLDRDHAGDHEPQQNTRHVYEDDIALLKPSTHHTLTADPQYVGPHRRYVACLGCFEEAQKSMTEIVAGYSDAERRVELWGEKYAATYALLQRARAALDLAHPALCSMHCPSVKKTGTEWTHTSECEEVAATRAALARVRALTGEGQS